MPNNTRVSSRKSLTLGGRIKALRVKAGISQEKFAFRVGVSRETIRRFEADIRIPRSDVLRRIAQELDIPPAELFEGAA